MKFQKCHFHFKQIIEVLQEKKVTPIGGQRDIDVDVRVIATTNRNMIEEVKEKKFREDLYYRLNVISIETCNSVRKTNDIIPISVALLKTTFRYNKITIYNKQSQQEIIKRLYWPGNVRELEMFYKEQLFYAMEKR